MTNAQILKDRIKNQCEKQEKSMTAMLSELSLGVNAVNQINEKKGMGAFTLSKIADYLNCSVDYLLGRTNQPNSTYSINGDNNTQAVSNGNNSPITFTTEKTQVDKTTEELVELILSLPLLKRAEAIVYLNNMRKNV